MIHVSWGGVKARESWKLLLHGKVKRRGALYGTLCPTVAVSLEVELALITRMTSVCAPCLSSV